MTFLHEPNAHEPDPFKGLLAGLTAGVTATVVMTGFQTALGKLMASGDSGSGEDDEQQSGDSQQREKQEQSEPATAKAATAISQRTIGHELSNQEKQTAAQAVHYGFGTLMGTCYGVASEYYPQITLGKGAAFGFGLFLAADEAAVPAMGFSGPPTQMPLSTHAYGLAAHLVYGVACEMVRDQVRQALD